MRPWLLAALAAAGCGDNLGPSAVPVVSGVSQIVLAGDSELVVQRNGVTLASFPATAFQVGVVDDLESGASFDPYWLLVDDAPAPPDGLEWRTADHFEVVESSARSMTLRLGVPGGSATVAIDASTAGNFRMVLASRGSDDHPVAYLRVQPTVDRDEHYYGLGEWADGVEHRGKLRPMQLEADLTNESSTDDNHVPVPLLIGTRGWGVFGASDYPGVFDVARASETQVDIVFGTGAASKDGLALYVFSADAPLDVLKAYQDVAGAPGLPAAWAYGPLLWRDENDDQAQVLDDIDQIRTLDLATSGMWFDRPYATAVNTFDWDPAKFPQPHDMLDALHAAGLRYGVWHVPYVEAGTPQRDEADRAGYFPPVKAVSLNQWGTPIDFTNPEAYAWWQDQLRAYTDDYGVEGFKLDYGEDIVVGLNGNRFPWRFADGSDERTMHRGYTLLYHRVYRELLSGEGAFVLARTGRWGDQVLGTIIWPGDLAADLSHAGDPVPGQSTTSVGGLPTALAFNIGLSASGFPFFASDTGGYRRSPASDETFVRWVEASTLSGAMQVGNSASTMPWDFAPESLAAYRVYARLHMRLFPYAWSYAAMLAATGRPLVRPFGLVFPELGKHPADQYLFGDSLFVAPVIEPGATTRTLFTPPGTWLDWWTGEELAGATEHTVDAPLDTLPLYVARGGIVPLLRDTVDTLVASTQPDVDAFGNDTGTLFVRVAPGPIATTFTLFDGSVIAQDANATELTFKRSVTPRFIGAVQFEIIATAAAPAQVLDGATALVARASYSELAAAPDGWFYDPSATGGTLWIKVGGGTADAPATIRVL
jgi:alpha-D-xyloside xylohydrolase